MTKAPRAKPAPKAKTAKPAPAKNAPDGSGPIEGWADRQDEHQAAQSTPDEPKIDTVQAEADADAKAAPTPPETPDPTDPRDAKFDAIGADAVRENLAAGRYHDNRAERAKAWLQRGAH